MEVKTGIDKRERVESKFTIVCRECYFSGGVFEFDISAEVCDCGAAEITITCRSCHTSMGAGS